MLYAKSPRATRVKQTGIGVALAAGIMATWLAVHVAAVWQLDAAQAPGLAVALGLLLTWLSTGLFITAHDAMHGSVAPGRPRINATIGRIALLLYAGFSWRRLIVNHFRHHRYAGTEDDPDFAPTGPAAWYFRFVGHYFGWREFWLLGSSVILYAVVLGERWPYVLFWAVPSILASVQLFFFGTYLPHRHEEAAPFTDRHNARSSGMPDWLSLLTCFHFGGYHHEHHLHPSVPWWALPGTCSGDDAETERAVP